MAQKPPAFQFYPGDFLVGTMHLTTEETGAYIRLLCIQWDKGEIPDDQEKCARMAGCQASAIAAIWHKFGICQAGARKNERLETERDKQTQFRSKQSDNGSRRWKNSGGNAKPDPSLSGGNAKPDPSLSGGNAKPDPSLSGGNAKPDPSLSGGNAKPDPSLSGGNAKPDPSLCPSSSSSIVPPFGPQGDQLEPAAVDTLAAEKKEGGRAAAQIASEAGARILAMFAPATQLSPVCFGKLLEHVATGTLPADEKKWRALEAMRAERAAITGIPEDYDLRSAWLFSKERLCRELAEALDTALAKRPQGTPDAPKAKKEPAPAEWQAKLAALYPAARIPATFDELPADLRAEVKGAA